MIKKAKINGLDCAHCAKTLEDEINKLKCISHCEINFVKSEMTYESDDEDALAKIKKLAKKIEPEAEIIAEESEIKEADETAESSVFTMKISGLDCAHCAKTLEDEIKKIKGIKNCEINFVKSELTYESDDKDALAKIKKLAKKIEPEAEITELVSHAETHSECHCCGEHTESEDEHNHSGKQHGKAKKEHKTKLNPILQDVITLSLGLVVGILSLVLKTSTAVHYVLLVASVLLLGYKIYIKAVRLIFRGVINENLLLTISVAGAIAIGKDMEAVMVISLYCIGKILEGLAVNKSRKSIAKITSFKPEYAVVTDGETEKKVSPSEVLLGATIIVRPGECVPIDGEIIQGETNLNTQSLTGESLPVAVKSGDKILSGSIVLDSVILVKTTALYKDSTVSKILNLIENNQQKKSKTETVISRVTKWYTLGVIALALLTFGIVFAVTGEFKTALYRGLIFLVISCPCAFAISVPLSYFSGLGNASSKGILIKGSVYLDACARIKTVVFDKTGTLTTGKFAISKVEVVKDGMTEKDILSLAGAGEQYSLHPLAKCITESTSGKLPKVSDVKEVAGSGVYFKLHSKNYFVGRRSKGQENTCVELYEDDSLLGKIYLADSVKETSAEEIADLKNMGIKTVILSGDKKSAVEKFADSLGIDEYESELLPQEKCKWIENHKNGNKETVAFVGDGLNDAPSLTLADVGFCMGLGGNPASVEASDIVLADDNPNKISSAIKISKYTRKIVWENIGFSALIKIVFLSLGAFGITGMLSAVIADVGVTVLAILNSLRALNYSTRQK